MKTYLSPRALLLEIEGEISRKQSSSLHSPLDKVVDILYRGRHYTWVGIYLTAGKNAGQRLVGGGAGPHPAQMARSETRSKILVSMKLAGRELGVLDVESDQENAFGSDDRVLLENVAGSLARFLSGPGKYIARKARAGQQASAAAAGM